MCTYELAVDRQDPLKLGLNVWCGIMGKNWFGVWLSGRPIIISGVDRLPASTVPL